MARDGQWSVTGARLQGHLPRFSSVRGVSRPGAPYGPQLGVVLRVRHKDEQGNPHQSFPVYDVLLAEQLLMLQNLYCKGFKLDDDSGEEFTLTPCSGTPDISDPTQSMQNILESDGDLVIVEWVSGRFPVISGTMNHLRSGDSAPWHGDSTTGERRAFHHYGASIVMTEDAKIRIISDDVNLGDEGATEHTILGDAFKTDLDVFLTAEDTFVTALSALPGIGPAATTFKAAILAFKNSIPGDLTTKVKVS